MISRFGHSAGLKRNADKAARPSPGKSSGPLSDREITQIKKLVADLQVTNVHRAAQWPGPQPLSESL